MSEQESNRAKFRWPEPGKYVEKGEGEIKISSDEARIFRMVHIKNVASIVRYGLTSRNYFRYPKYVEIGANKLIHKRNQTKVPFYPFGTVSDYVSFYFTPRSPMLYNVLNGINVIKRRSANKIIFVESSLFELERANLDYVYSDRHILSSEKVNFLDCLEDRNYVDWRIIDERTNRKRFRPYRQTNSVYQAEALVYEKVPPGAISKIVTNSEESMDRVCNEIYENTYDDMWLELPVDIAPEYYK